ncbi:MAG TPA: hypothetical protein PLM79_04185 [Syntrophobacteraceae bacterium]|nr:hypothetical protein [Syntrophobacteraceae bacterium]
MPGKVFLEMIRNTGFVRVEQVAETGFDSSPATRGVLIRAEKA